MSNSKKIIIAGGGSGGHVFPALSIADALNEKGISKKDIIFFGSKYSLEKTLVPENGYSIHLFPGRGVNKIKSLKYLPKNILNVLGLIAAFFQAVFLIFKIKPAVVVGVGGFASFPAIVGAFVLRRKIVVHEQNALLGRINKIAQKLGATVITTFSNVNGVEKPVHLGLPLRKEVLSLVSKSRQGGGGSDLPPVGRRGAEDNKKSIVIFGGSLGARIINNAVIEMSKTMSPQKEWDVTLITGPKNLDDVDKAIGDNNFGIKVVPFVSNLFEMLANSDLVVSRAGAGSCVELEVANVQAVLIPLAIAPGDHQSKNASDIVASGRAAILKEKDLNGQSLFDAISSGLQISSTKHGASESIHLTANIKIADYIVEHYLV